MSSTAGAYQKAYDTAVKAIKEDKNKNYEFAIRLYEDAVEYFIHAIKYEPADEKREIKIRAKCITYSARAKKLKEYLETLKSYWQIKEESEKIPNVFSGALKEALKLVKKAIEQDKDKNYDKAIYLYKHSAEYFLLAVKYEVDDEKQKDMIRSKYYKYLDRAKKLKKYLKSVTMYKNHIENGVVQKTKDYIESGKLCLRLTLRLAE